MTEKWLLKVGCTKEQAKVIQRMHKDLLAEACGKEEDEDRTKNKEKKGAVKTALLNRKGGRPYDVDLVAGLFDMDWIQMNEQGEITEGFQEQEDFLRKDKEYLFEPMEEGKWSKVG